MSTFRLHVATRSRAPSGEGGADAVAIEAPSLRHAQAVVLGRADEHFGADAASAWMTDEDGRRVWSLQIDEDRAPAGA
ncbi:hypothetical protein [Methylobacterium oryzihabitans]|uniref:Uncharacterized protein n=1 Tax=Methylobacterium oryzihabitans TaxID=2499852 RepID=A0A3S2VDN6_9HYPH|nr:hypothetical protein [Methylobacterium oryzihabitans]RVU20596.1 hypothetical protein EOE48_04385 [Methylobacterium oryzihabitans]